MKERLCFIEAKNKISQLMALAWVRRTGKMYYLGLKDRQEIIDQAFALVKEERSQNES